MDQDSLLLHAASICDAELAGKALRSGANPDCEDEDGFTPLMWAAIGESVQAARVLLAGGASARATNNRGLGALHFACRNADVGMARLLLEAGAEPSARDREGRTPFFCCFEPSGEAARSESAARGRIGCMELLKEAGASPNEAENRGRTVLMAALDGCAGPLELSSLARAGALWGCAGLGEEAEKNRALWAWKRACDKDCPACLDICEGLLPALDPEGASEVLWCCASCERAKSALWLLERGARGSGPMEELSGKMRSFLAAFEEKRQLAGIGQGRGRAICSKLKL